MYLMGLLHGFLSGVLLCLLFHLAENKKEIKAFAKMLERKRKERHNV